MYATTKRTYNKPKGLEHENKFLEPRQASRGQKYFGPLETLDLKKIEL